MSIFETETIVVLSTAHLTEQAAGALTARAQEEANRVAGDGTHHVWDREEGFMLYTGMEDVAFMCWDNSVSRVVDYVVKHMPNCRWILFDRDADTHPNLKEYDW